jgi:hypothetical protein
MRRLVRRFREEAKRVGFWWAFGFMTGYVTSMLERSRHEETRK